MPVLTHSDLCKLAVGWLQRPASRGGPGCLTALSETTNGVSGEIPDAIGWRPYRHVGCGSTVVEVKISRADFLADFAKPHRADAATGMGVYRYYMAPVGLLKLDELPARWGLLEVSARGHIKVRAGHVLAPNIRPSDDADPWRHPVFNMAAEVSLLAMALNRVGDPQKFQEMLRDASNRAARSVATIERLRERNNELEGELVRVRYGEVAPTPRRRRIEEHTTPTGDAADEQPGLSAAFPSED